MERKLSSDSKRGQFVRFCINGCLAVAIQYGVYWLLMLSPEISQGGGEFSPSGSGTPHWEGLGEALWTNIAYTISYIVSFAYNFIATSYWTFHSRPTWKRLIGFGSSHVVNFFVQLAFLNAYLYIGIPKQWSALMAMASAVPINFMILRFVYKKEPHLTSPKGRELKN